MKNFFLGFVIGIVFVGLVVVLLGFAAVRMAGTSVPSGPSPWRTIPR